MNSVDTRARTNEAASGEKVYYAHRVAKDDRIVQTHCIIADDDEDAVYLAETVGGNLRVDLWQGSRLVATIEP